MTDNNNLPSPSFKEVYRVYEQLQEICDRTYEAAVTSEDRLEVFRLQRTLWREMVELAAKQLRNSNKAYEVQTETMKKTRGPLEELKKRIERLFVAVEQIEQFVVVIDRVLELLGRAIPGF
jgi:hypothetical protein